MSPAARRGLRARLAGKSLYLGLALLVLALDQWSKWLVEARLPLGSVQPVFPGLNLTHVQNTGVAFGLFAEPGRTPWLLAALGLLAMTAVGVYFLLVPRRQRLLLTALGLVLGGAVGNLVDRVANGSVTDFIDVYVGDYHWYFFNLADSAISVGIALLVVDSLWPRRGRAEDGDRDGDPAGATS